jgi:dihydrofolate synthase / folylpolyglutamate synthase
MALSFSSYMKELFPTIDYVLSLTPGGMREGRDNILKLMKILWNPQDTLKVFHVTGSNGKWSVCQVLSQVLWKSCWKKVGLFISPYLFQVNEQFQINGISISDTELEKYYTRTISLGEKHAIPLTSFEIQVVTMILYFVDQKVDYAVVEVGLGGTYDGTNIFSHPLACFITSITLEHTHVLGKTRRSILKNKLWIAKPGTRLYTWIQNKQAQEYCKIHNVTLNDWSSIIHYPLSETNLPWHHQQKNATLVLRALMDQWFEKKKIQAWLMQIQNPGRFQWITPTILVDTANNRENIKILAKMISKIPLWLKTKDQKLITIYGTTQTDPGYAAELAKMIPCSQRILVDDFYERALPCCTYSKQVPHDTIVHLAQEKEKMRKILENPHKIKVIYGSLYLIRYIISESIHMSFAQK